MDIASLISDFSTATSYTITRVTRSTLSRGKAVAGTTSTITIIASVQQARGQDLLRLKEGRRTNKAKVIFTTTLLQTGGQGATYEADHILVGSESYEVDHVETWTDPDTGSVGYRCVATEAGAA